MRVVLSIFCLLALMLTTSTRVSQAAPQLDLRDRLDIQLDPIRRVGSQVLIRGRAVSRSDGEGAKGQKIRMQFDEQHFTLLTDPFGYFVHHFASHGDGTHLLMIDSYEGRFYDAAHLEMADFRVERRPLLLLLDAPSRIEDTSGIEIGIRATSDGQAVSLKLDISVASIGEALREAGQVTTDTSGEATLVMTRDELGAPGRKRLEIRYAGDENHDPATASSLFQITSTSLLSLVSQRTEFSFGDIIPVSGRLEDGRGEAVSNAVVTLEVQGQRIASAKTDERGDYQVAIDSEELGSGTSIIIQAIYRPTEDWKTPTRSSPAVVWIGARKPFSMSLALAAFAVTGIGLMSFVGLRARPWERVTGRKKTDTDSPDHVVTVEVPPPVTGLSQGRPKLSKTFRKAHYMDIEGEVRDGMTHEAIDMARIEIGESATEATGGTAQVLQTNAKGWFRTAALHAGEHTLRISAQGFVAEECSVRVPHRGEFHGTTIDLLPVREKIFALYKDALRPRLPNPKLWGIWTPRQILDHVRKKSPDAALAALTDFVEEAFFSQRTPNESVLEEARSLVWAFTKEEPAQGPRT